jgi:hypothetical protein
MRRAHAPLGRDIVAVTSATFDAVGIGAVKGDDIAAKFDAHMTSEMNESGTTKYKLGTADKCVAVELGIVAHACPGTTIETAETGSIANNTAAKRNHIEIDTRPGDVKAFENRPNIGRDSSTRGETRGETRELFLVEALCSKHDGSWSADVTGAVEAELKLAEIWHSE